MTEFATTVKIALLLAAVTQADIASQCRVERATVSGVVHGRSRSRKIENRIAAVTGVPREHLWPQWYGPDAQRPRKRLSQAEITRRLQALMAQSPSHAQQTA